MRKKLINLKEAAEYLSISTHFLYKLTSQKKINHVRIGKKILFDLCRLDEFINENSVEQVDWDEHIQNWKR